MSVRSCIKLTLLAVSVLFINSCAISGAKGRIHGTITDIETHGYISNAWVIAVADDDNGSEIEVCSECKGQFKLEGLEEGEYNITIFAEEYEIFTVSVPVSKGKTATADIQLTKENNLVNADAAPINENDDPAGNTETMR